MSRKSKRKSRTSLKQSSIVRAHPTQRPTRVAEDEEVIEILDEDVLEIMDDPVISYRKAL